MTIMPRMIGTRRIGPVYTPPSGWSRTMMSPSGLRQAMAMLLGPRIMTPSMTACPP